MEYPILKWKELPFKKTIITENLIFYEFFQGFKETVFFPICNGISDFEM